MKTFNQINESTSDDLLARVKFNDKLKEENIIDCGKELGPKSTNALYLTMMWASKTGDSEIISAAASLCDWVKEDRNEFVKRVIELNDKSDTEGTWMKYIDGTDSCTWIIYRTYLAKTIAKEEAKSELDDCNKYLRTFKNSWEKSWNEIETDVRNMNEGTLPDLQETPVKDDTDVTNQEVAAAVEDVIDDEEKLLSTLIKRAGLNKKKLADYVNLIISKSFKEVHTNDDNEQVIAWKKKVANGEPTDSNFILGISSMICGAIITGDKNTINEIFKYLENKTQEDLKKAKNSLMK